MEYCKDCSGKMEDSMGARCPDYPGDSRQRQQAEEQTITWERERAARGRSAREIRKTPDGPQGYRKPRKESS
jgi:hypothetical protein